MDTTQIQQGVDLVQAFPWLTLVAVIVPLLILARRNVFPNWGFLVLAGVPCLLALLTAFQPDLIAFVLIVDIALIVIPFLDLFTLAKSSHFRAQREHLGVASLSKELDVSFVLHNDGITSKRVAIRDDLPESFEVIPNLFADTIPPETGMSFNYTLRANERGEFPLNCIYVQVTSALRMFKRVIRVPCRTTINVFPDLQQVSHYTLLARSNRLNALGVRRIRRVGQDNEFERLRDYTRDDHYRAVDWRATARHSKLIVRDFQSNQNQRVIFLVDCGRMMTNHSEGHTYLDHAFNAMLMLSHVALTQGDSVGLICFSDRIHKFIPPGSGKKHLNRLLHASFDEFPEMVESRYDEAFQYLARRSNRRALVILITNVIDEVNSQQIQSYMQSASTRHLPISVLLRDHEMFNAANQRNDIFKSAAAAEILNWRHQVISSLEQQGIRALDVYPEDLTAPLVNQYLEIKARHLL